jgi:glycosyltransferase involved in cell wall biosynthesis
MSKKVSVAIPTYNRLGYLKECLDSIVNQTFQDFDIFVFDNASDEPVEKELQKFQDPRIHFIGHKENVGSAGNINRILQYEFDSEYVLIFHDDDTMHPKMLEIETSFLDTHKNVGFVVADLHHVMGEDMRFFPQIDKDAISFVLYQSQQEFVGKAIMQWRRYAFNSAMYRRQALQEGRLDFDRFSDFADVAFLVDIAKKGPSAFLDAQLVNYRLHAEQDSQGAKESYEQGALELLRFFFTFFSSANSKDKKVLHQFALNFLLRSSAHMNKGFLHFVRFFQKARAQGFVVYRDFAYIDVRGFISLVSVLLHNKKIIDAARWTRNKMT